MSTPSARVRGTRLGARQRAPSSVMLAMKPAVFCLPQRFPGTLSALLAVILGASSCNCGGPRVVAAFELICRAETCDGMDEDCDGAVDNGLPSASCGVGACARTIPSCVAGVLQTCQPGAAVPEQCNGFDDDCDGQTDEDLAPISCGVGQCAVTVSSCSGGAPQQCVPRAALAESCNGLDDDCNGVADEGLLEVSCGVGECARTVPSCVNGMPHQCQPLESSAEICDGKDNDCDGQTDEELAPVSCGVGVCARTTPACIGGQPQTCTAGVPVSEICDGLDNDCDGQSDQGLAPLSCGLGACQRMVTACVSGLPQSCTPGVPSPEMCDGVDNDCDGQIDEGLAPLSCGVGACARTTTACAGGIGQTCTPGLPSAESCNGIDDDCDGQADEGLAPLSCGTGACARTVAACAGGIGQACTPGLPGAESCNGIDDDCDGQADEGLPPLSCGIGACARTLASCTGGVPQTCSPGAPVIETCNGLDDDCDGLSDEELPLQSCGLGDCARTQVACLGGVTQACRPGLPVAESCDGRDNNCDGAIDEGGVCQPPVVMCPAAMSTFVGTTLTLAATASDPDGAIVSAQWAVSARPAGSSAQPATPNATSTFFTPDTAGNFSLSFCARDNAGLTSCCTTAIATTLCTSPPSPPVSTACGTSWDGRPIVQFAPVPAGLVYELSVSGQTLVLATAAPSDNHMRPAIRIASGGPPPGAPVDLDVRACRSDARTCCSAPSSLSIQVVESCSAPLAPSSATVVLSEYIVNGEGTCPSPNCATQDTCQAGESVEITNLSNCPIALDGHHFAYRNSAASTQSYRWMNFGPSDVIPPRGVYVAIRNRSYAPTCAAPLGTPSSGLYGLHISALSMQGINLCSGWFNNTGGGMSEMRVAPGTIPVGQTPSFTPGTALSSIAPYLPTSGSPLTCTSVGFDAVDSCGTIVGGTTPTAVLSPNQLGRLWHPCDAVVGAVPACIRD